jgi:hypothetical protein
METTMPTEAGKSFATALVTAIRNEYLSDQLSKVEELQKLWASFTRSERLRIRQIQKIMGGFTHHEAVQAQEILDETFCRMCATEKHGGLHVYDVKANCICSRNRNGEYNSTAKRTAFALYSVNIRALSGEGA